MTSTTEPSTTVRPVPTHRAGYLLWILGGIAFLVGGGLHPKDSGSGDKLAQLHDMLVSSMWYPSHAVLVFALALITAAVIATRRHTQFDRGMRGLIGVVAWISILASLAMLIHFFAASEASAIADGHGTFLIELHTWNETIINPLWGAAMALLALAGGLTRTVGNRIVLSLGVLGGLAFALSRRPPSPTPTPSTRSSP